jgi:DNA-directed RNA polymerase subunit RPC12/RpoP
MAGSPISPAHNDNNNSKDGGMSDIVMKFVPADEAGDRTVFNTGVAMIGLGGENWRCGDCRREMMHGVAAATLNADLLYRCNSCGALNEVPR